MAASLLACWKPATAEQSPEPAPVGATTGSAVSHGNTFQENLLLVDVNDQHINQTVLVLLDSKGNPWIAAADLARWRLKLPDVAPHTYGGQPYFPLSAIPGVKFRIDSASQSLAISAPPHAFTTNAFAAQAGVRVKPVLPQPGGFFNYDVSATHTPGSTTRAGLFEAGYFDRHGVLTNDMLANDLGTGLQAVRLDTTWEHDDPEKMTSIRFGDEINRPASVWGRAVRFGGIQYGTDFATQPGFITFPLAATSGQAVLPSTVDVYVNNALVAQDKVPPGPFSITNIPVITGSGNVQLVVTDLLGRQQVITSPFYASQGLLKKGPDDYSYELGFVRNNFGLSSNDYGSWLSSATYRRGITDRFTGEVHGELMAGQETVGTTASYLWNDFGIVTGSAAASSSDAGSGGLFAIGFQRQTPTWGFGFQSQWTNQNFRQIGLAPGELPESRLITANASYTFNGRGTLGVAYVDQTPRDQPEVKVASLNYSVPLGHYGSLGFAAIKTFGDSGNLTFFTTFTIPFGTQTSASVTTRNTRQSDDNSGDTTYTLQHSLPLGEGFGYRLLAQDHGDFQAAGSYQNNVGTYTAEVDQFSGQTSERVGMSGGIGLIGGHAFLSRSIDNSFGLVEVPGYANVRVLQDNQIVGRTDANGYAVLPQLRAYDRNPISIDQGDLPLDAQVDSLTLTAVPYYRSGVLLKFPVRHARGALLHIKLDDGSYLPAGATVRIKGESGVFPVAYQGEAYLTGLPAQAQLVAEWKNQSCAFDIAYPQTKEPIPNLGTFVCHGVHQ
jgi:outer membrane usher protein